MGYLRYGLIQNHEGIKNNSRKIQHSKARISENKKPDEFRVESIINAVKRGRFTHYVRGGFSRSNQTWFTPSQVAQHHQLNLDTCLFEINDYRVQQVVRECGLLEVSANSYINK